MARLKIDDGFTRIHNELIDRVFCRVTFPAYEMRLIWALIRMTWGWNRRGCYSSYRELSRSTGMDVRHVTRTIKALIEKYIVVTRVGSQRTYFEINTDYMTWRLSEPQTLSLFNRTASGGASPPALPEAAPPDDLAVASRGNTPPACRGNTPPPVEATPSVASRGNTTSPERITRREFAAFLKKL